MTRPAAFDKIWKFFDEPTSSRLAYAVSVFFMGLIFLSTASFVLETVDTLKKDGELAFFIVEVVCIAFFTLELILRLISCPSKSKFFKGVFNWVDILAIVPFYLELAIPNATGAGSFGVIRVVRLVRVARIVKVSRYSMSIRIFSQAMMSSIRPLSMLIFLVSIAMVMFASGVYFAELTDDGCREWGVPTTGEQCTVAEIMAARAQNQTAARGCKCEEKNPFTSIPATFWYILVTMTTVGYGDMVPVTAMGKLVAVCAMISGIIILALPITVIGSNFSRVLREIQQEKVLEELEELDKDGDGVVDVEELKVMLKSMTAAAGHPSAFGTAEELIAKYDADNSGVLEAHEVEALKAELAARLKILMSDGEAPSAEPTLTKMNTQDDDDPLSMQSLPGQVDSTLRSPLSSPNTTTPSHVPSSQTVSAPPKPANSEHTAVSRPRDASASSYMATAAVAASAAAAASGGSGGGPLHPVVSAKLADMEGRVDMKLRTIMELLKKMNAAVAQTTSSEPLL